MRKNSSFRGLSLENIADVERAILGAIMLDNVTYWEATEELSVEDFSLTSHQVIYRTMAQLREGRPVDIITLSEELSKKDQIDIVGGIAYLASLTDGLPRRPSVKRYVEIVKEASRRRQYLLALKEANDAARLNSDMTTAELATAHERRILDIAAKSAKGQPRKVADLVDTFYETMERLKTQSGDKKAVGYRTGHEPLDEMTTGYRKREMTIISGWTSHGKSILMKQGVLANIADEVMQAVFTKEVSWEQFLLNLIATVGMIHPDHARDQRLMDLKEQAHFAELKRRAKKWPLWIDDTRNLHIDEVVSRARKLVRVEGVKITWVDYLGLIHGSGKTPVERATSVCNGLWGIGDGEDIPMVVLAQLSRDESKKEVIPSIQHLKDASIIEQAAQSIIFVWREKLEDGTFKFGNKDRLKIAKQRSGKVGNLPIKFNEDTLLLEEGSFK